MVIADLASRVPVAIDGRGACALVAVGGATAATILMTTRRRARRLRPDAHVPLPPR
jgi:hypothetical protein